MKFLKFESKLRLHMMSEKEEFECVGVLLTIFPTSLVKVLSEMGTGCFLSTPAILLKKIKPLRHSLARVELLI